MRRAKVGSGELKTVGKYSIKGYKCDRCGHVSMQGTNHWGKIYNLRCPDCSWRNPMNPFVTMSSIEKMPKGYKKPKEWKTISLGEVKSNKPSKNMNPKFKKYLKEHLKNQSPGLFDELRRKGI